jgi:enamine deaminase RidA (YjgF/YER057c/UK114 family)
MKRSATSRRAFIAGSLAGISGASLAALPAKAQDAKETAKSKLTGLSPADAPPADGFTHGILAEGRRMVFVSGRGPKDRNADMETQIRQTLQNVAKVLEVAGATMENVVILRAYFLNIQRDLAAYRKVRKEFFAKPYPASTSVGVSALAVPGLQVEIEAVAVL